MEWTYLTPIIISLFFSFIFSGLEIAFVSSDRLHIELQGQQGKLYGRILSRFIKNPSRFISTTLVGNTIALVLYGVYMAKMIEPWLVQYITNEAALLIIQTVISTLVVLLTAEFLPKSLFLINPNQILKFFAIPMNALVWILTPVTRIIVWLSKGIIIKVMRLEYAEDRPVYNLTDLNNYIKNTLSVESDSKVEVDTKIFHNALEFKTVRVRECMIPRTEIVAVDVEDSIEELQKAFVESGHSKILVYRESIDEVIGYCHSLELFKKPKKIADILTPITYIPETMLANELMVQFITTHKSLALVVDEFGGTSGIVSIEDIIEEIFGEIQDEHDVDDWVEAQVNDNTWMFSARHEIDYLNDEYSWELPTGDYETLGGLILSITEDLPKIGDAVELPPFTFTIQSMQDIRIETVKVTVRPE
ncbi:MAG: hemolysin family protein [Candidatus Cyclobacteriaceae bacterium M2_1C_046]